MSLVFGNKGSDVFGFGEVTRSRLPHKPQPRAELPFPQLLGSSQAGLWPGEVISGGSGSSYQTTMKHLLCVAGTTLGEI